MLPQTVIESDSGQPNDKGQPKDRDRRADGCDFMGANPLMGFSGRDLGGARDCHYDDGGAPMVF